MNIIRLIQILLRNNLTPSQERVLVRELRKIIKKVAVGGSFYFLLPFNNKSSSKDSSKETVPFLTIDDILNELIIILLKPKNKKNLLEMINRNLFHPKYIETIIGNMIIDFLRKKERESRKNNKFKEYIADLSDDAAESEELGRNELLIREAEKVKEILYKKLTKKELEAIREIFSEDEKKDAAHYKRVERLKKKLAQIKELKDFSEEAIVLALKMIAKELSDKDRDSRSNTK